jgi:hypothetical protein
MRCLKISSVSSNSCRWCTVIKLPECTGEVGGVIVGGFC